MQYRTLLPILMLSAVVLAGCRSNPPQEADSDLLSSDGVSDNAGGVNTDGVTISDAEQGLAIDPNSVSGRAPQDRVIYFDFDSDQIRPEYLDIVAQHGRFLAQNADGRVRLEGHTDERGTREYNIALGENRAKSIGSMLQLQGVGSVQVRTVSYGEELPVDEGHDSDAWTRNRRVNIIYEVSVPN